MDTRQWLGRARTIDREITALLRAKNEARDRLLRVTPTYGADGAQSNTKDPHKYDRLIELERMIDDKIDDLIAVKEEITEAIQSVADGRQRTVLLDYYVRCISLEQTAVEMNYSYANVKKLRARAITSLERANPEKFIPNYPSSCDSL